MKEVRRGWTPEHHAPRIFRVAVADSWRDRYSRQLNFLLSSALVGFLTRRSRIATDGREQLAHCILRVD